MNNIRFDNLKVRSLENKIIKNQPKERQNQSTSFNQVLSSISGDDIKFSKHARTRLKTRDIKITDLDMDRIKEGITKAENKGVKEALILMDKKAFIVSVKNKTVVTTLTEEQLKDSVFTNIDGAVII